MTKAREAVFLLSMFAASSLTPALAQHNNNNFNHGMRQGGHGGNYYDGHNDQRYSHDDHRHDNGIGPGKGALIGAAGGAALGAVFGGGLKGTIVGGAAGAGIGAVVGQAAQNNRRDNYHR